MEDIYGVEDEFGMLDLIVATSKYKSKSKKEYTEQALINTKIAALKEVAKKYPRSLIRSKVVGNNELFSDDLEWQKIPNNLC